MGNTVPLTPRPGCLSGLGSSKDHVGAWKITPLMEGLWSGRQGFMIPKGEVILRHLSQLVT